MDKYPHILEEVKICRRNLRFKEAINDSDGSRHVAFSKPDDWENVRHVVGSIYYAWGHDPLLGQLFLAEWVEGR